MNEAIKLAIEKGGYESRHYLYQIDLDKPGDLESSMFSNYLTQDPLFWQALGKALGWQEYTHVPLGNWDEVSKMTTHSDFTWKYHAKRYFDLVLTGGDTEAFWKELISSKL
jgi:hypothetical protein